MELPSVRLLHIPKTAGTSFKRYLQKAYPEEQYIEFAGHQERDRWIYDGIESGRLSPRLVGGHAPIETGITSVDSMPTLTLLRDPVERVLSFCHHASAGKSPYIKEAYPPETFELACFLRSGNFELSNLQCAMLTPGWSMYGREPIERPDVPALVNIIESKQISVGFVERLPESIFLFSRRFQLPLQPLVRANRTARTIDGVSEAVLERIRGLNEADQLLYDQLLRNFDATIEGLDAHATEALRIFKQGWRNPSQSNNWIGRLLKKVNNSNRHG